MPTYEYECQNCGDQFERFQSMTDEPLKRCPKCRHKVKRLLGTGGGIIFKGSGFYETDYRSEDYAKKAKAAKTADSVKTGDSKKTGSKDSAAKTESKTAGSSEKGADK